MGMARFNAAEIACIKKLAELFENGTEVLDCRRDDPLGLPPEQRNPILRTMEECGFITDSRHRASSDFYMLTITAQAVQAAREIRAMEGEQAQMDLVEQMKLTMRRKPW